MYQVREIIYNNVTYRVFNDIKSLLLTQADTSLYIVVNCVKFSQIAALVRVR